ncbi:MAG: VOC family protein [Sphingomonadaceae bacterium]
MNVAKDDGAYKPEGYTDLSPYLVVANAQATLDFVAAVFESQPLRVIRNGDDRIVHAEARIGDTVLMIGEMPDGPESLLHVYVPDPDETYRRAIAAGATEIEPVRDKEDGDRRGGVSDANRTRWYFARSG